jgi:hypothetical protein
MVERRRAVPSQEREAVSISAGYRDLRRGGAWESTWTCAVLAAGAVFAVGIGVFTALDRHDAEALESPLLLSVARQLLVSPWELYGPFGGHNPLVLIHAPLYYHFAALLAWPLASAGLDSVQAAMVAGRTLSVLDLVLTLWAVQRLARLGGAPARAGWLAVLVLASAPVVGAIPFAVRPDMLGVALQTIGILLVLSVLHDQRRGATTLSAGFLSFGLAICVKQHFIAGPLVSAFLLFDAGRRGAVAFRFTLRGVLSALAAVLVIYGVEELATKGRMSQAVFIAAANVGRVHPSDLGHALTVLFAIIGRSTGLIALLAASALALMSIAGGLLRRVLVAAGTLLVGLIFVLVTLEVVYPDRSQGVYMLPALFAAALLILPGCAFLERRSVARSGPDGALWHYLAAELVLMLLLCRSSTGAWVNYAIPSVVVASVLTGRILDRALSEVKSPVRLIPIALAASVVPVGTVMGAYWSAQQRRNEASALARVLREVGRPRSEFFFVDRPGENRASGRLDLVFDEWLYPVFESIHLAEPRSIWLRRALTVGSVSVIVCSSEDARIDGIGLTLEQLGYARRFHVGRFFVWERILARRRSSGDVPRGITAIESQRVGRSAAAPVGFRGSEAPAGGADRRRIIAPRACQAVACGR